MAERQSVWSLARLNAWQGVELFVESPGIFSFLGWLGSVWSLSWPAIDLHQAFPLLYHRHQCVMGQTREKKPERESERENNRTFPCSSGSMCLFHQLSLSFSLPLSPAAVKATSKGPLVHSRTKTLLLQSGGFKRNKGIKMCHRNCMESASQLGCCNSLLWEAGWVSSRRRRRTPAPSRLSRRKPVFESMAIKARSPPWGSHLGEEKGDVVLPWEWVRWFKWLMNRGRRVNYK